MVKFKVNLPGEGGHFVVTRAYEKLCREMHDLKHRKGRIIQVIGAPGTGKSTNIYQAIKELDMDVYNAVLLLDDVDESPSEVYQNFFKTLKEDMGAKSVEEVYRKASKYDAILLADRFHDSHYLYEGKVGFSLWMDRKGVKSFPFYLRFIVHYFRNISRLRGVNLVFQTAWTIKVNGEKRDLFTDFGGLSRFFVSLLKIFFVVVEISYSEPEIMEIVKTHLPDADEERIKLLREQYGSRIRFILQAVQKKTTMDRRR